MIPHRLAWLSSLSILAIALGFSVNTLSSMAWWWWWWSSSSYNNNINNINSNSNSNTTFSVMNQPPTIGSNSMLKRGLHTTTSLGSAWVSVSNLDQLRFLATAIAAVVATTTPVVPTSRHRTNYVHTIQIDNQSVCGPVHDDQQSCLVHFTDTINRDDYCLFSQPGMKRTSSRGVLLPNQDRIALFHTTSTKQQQLLALFDGHNAWGHESAQAAQVDLPWNILTNLRQHLPQQDESIGGSGPSQQQEEERIKSILNESFVQMDRDRSIRLVPDSGSTALVILQQDSKVYLASAGDSTAFCAQWSASSSSSSSSSSSFATSPEPNGGSTQILVEAVRHKPGDPKERARIEQARGQVWIPAKAGKTTRVGIPRTHSSDGSADEIIWLAMSRSLGDEEGKKLGYLLAEPSIQVLDLASLESPDNVFCVAASDGLTDVLALDYVAHQLGTVLYGNNSSQMDTDAGKATADTQLGETCRDLVLNAAQRWGDHYRDDVSIVVSKIFLNS